MGMLARAVGAACLPAGIIAAAGVSLTGCQREYRDIHPTAETPPRVIELSDLIPGGGEPLAPDPRGKVYEGNAFHIGNGQRYFTWFNCTGCHANGGGGIGPSLMDNQWRYGGRIEQIYDSISRGRPNGMPSFKDKIPPGQIWELAAFVRSLSGEANKVAAPSRPDTMRAGPPINNANPQPQVGDAGDVTGGG